MRLEVEFPKGDRVQLEVHLYWTRPGMVRAYRRLSVRKGPDGALVATDQDVGAPVPWEQMRGLRVVPDPPSEPAP